MSGRASAEYIDSLKKVAGLRLKKMFCAFRGVVEGAQEAVQHKIEYLEYLGHEVEKGVQRGLTSREIQRQLLGRGDRYSLISAGEFSKRNLIHAFLRSTRGQG